MALNSYAGNGFQDLLEPFSLSHCETQKKFSASSSNHTFQRESVADNYSISWLVPTLPKFFKGASKGATIRFCFGAFESAKHLY